MKPLLLTLLYLAFVSCNTGQEPDPLTATAQRSEDNVPLLPVVDSAFNSPKSAPPDQFKDAKPVFPKGHHRTIPELMKKAFSVGSFKREVILVQGPAEHIERQDAFNETWFYGNSQVKFRGQQVVDITDPDDILRFADLMPLLFSTDTVEADWAELLIRRRNTGQQN